MDAWADVQIEMDHQVGLWGHQYDRTHEQWFTIMMEELGEACRAHLHESVENRPVDMSSYDELVQLAAIVIRALIVWNCKP